MQLNSSVQGVLDSAVDGYYELIAKKSTIGFTFDNDFNSDFLQGEGVFDSIARQIDLVNENFGTLDSLELGKVNGMKVFRGSQADSLIDQGHNALNRTIRNQFRVESHDHIFKDSLELKDFQLLTSKVIISISSDSLRLKELDSLVGDQLNNQKLDLDYRLIYRSPDSALQESKPDTFKSPLVTYSKSSFLPAGSSLKMEFTNETRVLLKKSLVGILISTLLVLGVIGSLFYLLGVIRNQKQLAEVKNDLISNITHEFKTPIATIGVALEGFENFKAASDPSKARSYLDISNQQLGKLNTMVEKLLETATLDSDTLIIQKERVEINRLIDSIVRRYQIANPEKNITFISKTDSIFSQVDTFHFENAISNLIDNAVKYGGDSIRIMLDQTSDGQLELVVHDDGKALPPAEKQKIFDKFYRVPKGNTHDVKGFGIGLYYSKTIIEKHGGSIAVAIDDPGTSFIVKIH